MNHLEFHSEQGVNFSTGAAVEVLLNSPFGGVDGLGGFQIERQMLVNLISEIEEPSATLAIQHWNRESIQYIVLIEIKPVVVVSRIESLSVRLNNDGNMGKVILHLLRNHAA